MDLCGKYIFDELPGWNRIGWQADLSNFNATNPSEAMKMLSEHPSISAAERLGFLPEGFTIEFEYNLTLWNSRSLSQNGVGTMVSKIMFKLCWTGTCLQRGCWNFSMARRVVKHTLPQW